MMRAGCCPMRVFIVADQTICNPRDGGLAGTPQASDSRLLMRFLGVLAIADFFLVIG